MFPQDSQDLERLIFPLVFAFSGLLWYVLRLSSKLIWFFSDKTLTPKEKLSIIKWIKAAEKEPQLGGVALGRVGPVTEGLLVWTLGLGLLIGIAVWLAAKAK